MKKSPLPCELPPNECELCHKVFSDEIHIFPTPADGDPCNTAPENTLQLCGQCAQHWKSCNKDGLKKPRVLFAFALNRNLYPFQQVTQ